jgi:Carboxypeptidase regulatory-like domain
VLLTPSAPETLSRRGQRNKGIGTKLLRGVWFLCVLLLIVPSNVLLAQLGRGQIEGTIRDSSSAVIFQAQVAVIDERTGATRTTTTDSQGNLTIAQLLPSMHSPGTQFVTEPCTRRVLSC